MLETKKYQACKSFFQKIVESKILDKIDISNPAEQLYRQPDEDGVFVMTIYRPPFVEKYYNEIKIEYNNYEYLKTIGHLKKTDFHKQLVAHQCYVYDKNVWKGNFSPSPTLLKHNEIQNIYEFVYNSFWFREFRMKKCITFTGLHPDWKAS